MTVLNPKIPAVGLGEVFERVNKRGQRYLAGRLGAAKLLIVPSGEMSRGEPVWRVFVGEAPYTDESLRGAAQAQVED
jgi:hypothetical protein